VVHPFERADLEAFLASRYGTAPGGVSLAMRPVRSAGLTAEVARATARRADGARERLVIKRLLPGDAREATAYRALAASGLAHTAPELLGSFCSPRAQYLCLEYVTRRSVWPWRDLACAGLVLDAVAAVHATADQAQLDLTWDYETELRGSSEYTRHLLDEALARTHDVRLRRGRATLHQFSAVLPGVRRELLADAVFLHGDVHPGNVRLQSKDGTRRVVLLDWGRARRGSRFEDVASWLQCLRYYEPAAARGHDGLLGRYVRGAGLGERVTGAHRRAYWLAAGSNAMAGALHVHLAGVLHAENDGARAGSLAAAADWLRILRRSLAWWESNDDGGAAMHA
jgi:aminoglycoside phosphotransferase (APT) family kinase protein